MLWSLPSVTRAARWEFARLSPTFPAGSGLATARLATANLNVGAGAQRGARVSPFGGERHDGAGWGAARRDSVLGEDSSVPVPHERSLGSLRRENTPEPAHPRPAPTRCP